jgi:hypothetical protein
MKLPGNRLNLGSWAHNLLSFELKCKQILNDLLRSCKRNKKDNKEKKELKERKRLKKLFFLFLFLGVFIAFAINCVSFEN